jgi:hypothetical protein
LGVSHGQLVRLRDLRDVEQRIFSKTRLPHEIAAIALAELCYGDNSSQDHAVIAAVVHFLNRTAGAIELESDRIDCYKSLNSKVLQSADYDEFLKLVQQWWP